MLYPFGLGFYYSLTNYWLQYPHLFRFVWFDNYVTLVTEPLFVYALRVHGRLPLVAVSCRSASGWPSPCSCTRASPGAAWCARSC